MNSIISMLTDTEFCILEQLAYLDEDVAQAASDQKSNVDLYKICETDKGRTIAEILSVFDERALANLRKSSGSVCSAQVSGVEWARIIKFLQDGRAASLVLEELMLDETGYHSASDPDGRSYNYPLALCFSDGTGKNNEAVVVFKGTTGPGEWADNVRAAVEVDTPPQRKALEFVEKAASRFGNISVVGHSKGSNKAMYTAVMSDNVVRCVGFDGQGFSRVFLEKPEIAERIRNRADIIKNYSLTGDFVHILLYQIPGSHQLFCKGYCVDSVGENHSPNSFFQQSSDGSDEKMYSQTIMVGNTSYIIPRFEVASENTSIETLHSFVDYLLSRGENVEGIIGYLAKILPIVIVGEDENGTSYDSKGKIKAVFSDTDNLTALVTNLTAFVKEKKLDGNYAASLLGALGVDASDVLSLLLKL